MDRRTGREQFVLRATPVTADPAGEPESYVLRDLFPMRGNTPTLFCRNNDEDVDGVVKVQDSSDRETWSDVASVTVKKKGRNKLNFTTTEKYVRFILDDDVPDGVFCELVHYQFDPVHQAGV